MYVKSISAGMLLFAISGSAFAFPPPPKGASKHEHVVPIPADFDGDGKTDLAELTSAGVLRIDFAKNGFGHWDVVLNNTGDLHTKVFAADFDGDKRTDIGLRTQKGVWKIDYAGNGFGKWDLDKTITMNAKNPIREFLGQSIGVFDNPEKVEVFHIKIHENGKGKSILGHTITASACPKIALLRFGLLKSLVLNVNNYQLDSLPRTKQYPNYAIRITNGKESVTILYSTHTKLLSITRGDDEFFADFAPGAADLNELLNAILPLNIDPVKES